MEQLHAEGVYHVECIGPDGEVKWTDVAYNLIPNEGKNYFLDTIFAGSAYTAAPYMSLITGATTATATSTYASPTVTETTGSVIANRLAITSWNAAATGSKGTNLAVAFPIIGSATITGNMVVSGGSGVATVGNTAATGGKLWSAAMFSGGSKTVGNGDTLNVSYSVSI